jgi:hypothetical protein
MQVILLVKRPWLKWVAVLGLGIGVVVALNTGLNPNADHNFTVKAVQTGIAFWVLLGVVVYATKGVEFRVADKAPE